MVVLLPAEGKSLDECLPQLNDERWGEWNSSLSSSALNLTWWPADIHTTSSCRRRHSDPERNMSTL